MKRSLTVILPLLALAAPAAFSQDPGFRPAEAPRPAAAPAPVVAPAPVKDDTASAVAVMGSMDRLDDTYRLKARDSVLLRIVEDSTQAAPRSLKVLDSGNINAPFINLVPVSGKTCKEVAFYMKRELEKQHFKVATVILAVEEIYTPTGRDRTAVGPQPGVLNSGYITIYGQVQRQGRYEVNPEEDLTVSQAVLRAGGFAQFAKDKDVKVIRKYPSKGNVTIRVNLRDVMMKGKLEYDIQIRGGDVIIVDEKLVNF